MKPPAASKFKFELELVLTEAPPIVMLKRIGGMFLMFWACLAGGPLSAAEDPGLAYQITGVRSIEGRRLDITSSIKDGSGNTYLSGSIGLWADPAAGQNVAGYVDTKSGRVTLGAEPYVNFVAKADPQGELDWLRLLPSDAFSSMKNPLHLDAAGNVIYLGRIGGWWSATSETVDIDGRQVTAPVNNIKIFLAKFDTAGLCTELTELAHTSIIRPSFFYGELACYDSAMAEDGSIYLAGLWSYNATFGGLEVGTPPDVQDKVGFVAKFAPDRTGQWVTAIDGRKFEVVKSLALVERAGHYPKLFVAGKISAGAEFQGQIVPVFGSKPNEYVASLTDLGDAVSHGWITVLGEQEYGGILWLEAFDAGEDIRVVGAGQYTSNVTLLGAELVNQSPGTGDVFAVELRELAGGAPAWLRSFSGPGEDNLTDLAFDPRGNVLFAGLYEKSLAIHGTELVSLRPQEQAGREGFIAKFDPSGYRLWTLPFGSAEGSLTSMRFSSVGETGATIAAASDGPHPMGGQVIPTPGLALAELVAPPGPNAAPIARDDHAGVPAGQPLQLHVLANDRDPEGGVLLVSGITMLPQNGTASVNAGVIRYVPAPGFTGRDTLEYAVLDSSGGIDRATVFIEVHAVERTNGWTIERFGPFGQSGQLFLDGDGSPRFSYVSPYGIHHYWKEGGEWHAESLGLVDAPVEILFLRDGPGVLHLFAYDSFDSSIRHLSNGTGSWEENGYDFVSPTSSWSFWQPSDPNRRPGMWSAALNAQGRVVLHVHDPDGTLWKTRFYTLGVNDDWTFENLAVTHAEYPSLVIDGSNFKSLADRRAGDVVVFSDGTGWTDGNATVVDDFTYGIQWSEPETSVQMTRDAAGTRWLAYDLGRQLKVARDTGGSWVVEPAVPFEVDSPRIAHGSAGEIHLAYFVPGTQRLGYARKPSGGQWQTSLIGEGDRCGFGPQLAIKPDGLPMVLSFDAARNAVSIASRSPNRTPIAVADEVTVFRGLAAIAEVLANDFDLDGDPLTVTISTPPAIGEATVQNDGRILVRPPANFAGTLSFSYTISDGQGGTDTATVSVAFTGMNPLDADGDHLDDVWALFHGVPAGTADDDPDGDGVDNRTESLWGTDPHDSQSSNRLSTTLAQDGLGIAMHTLAGRRYQFQGSEDLKEWLDLGDPFFGTAGSMEWLLPPDAPERFGRVGLLSNPDSDSDGLSDWHEMLLGTDHTLSDSDGDGLSDLEEILIGRNPLDAFVIGGLRLSVVSGNGQISDDAGLLKDPMWVRVTDGAGNPVSGIALSFTVTSGPLGLAESGSEMVTAHLDLPLTRTIVTNASGEAMVHGRFMTLDEDAIVEVNPVLRSAMGTVRFMARATEVLPVVSITQERTGNYMPFRVKIEVSPPQAAIHYTIDGSEPTLASEQLASGGFIELPFLQFPNHEIRAAAHVGERFGPVASHRVWLQNGAQISTWDDVAWLVTHDSIWSIGGNDLGQQGRGFDHWPPVTATDYFSSQLSSVYLDAYGNPDATYYWTNNNPVRVAVGGMQAAAVITPASIDDAEVVDPERNTLWGTAMDNGFPSVVPTAEGSSGVVLMEVVQAAAGGGFRAAVAMDGRVHTQGMDNSLWQLGHGSVGDAAHPVSGLAGVKAISCAHDFSLVVKVDGTVHGWGNNHNGNLGAGHSQQGQQVFPATGLTGVSSVVASQIRLVPETEPPTVRYDVMGRFGVALDADGGVWTWGSNLFGNLGTGDTTDTVVPVRVAGLPGISTLAVSPSSGFVLALATDGMVWAWGNNRSGQMGAVGSQQSGSPVPVPLPARAMKISAGSRHALALLEDGRLFAWGDNSEFQLGQGNNLVIASPVEVPLAGGVIEFAAGDDYSLAILTNGNISFWGTMIWRRAIPSGTTGFPVKYLSERSPRLLHDNSLSLSRRYPDVDTNWNFIDDAWEIEHFGARQGEFPGSRVFGDADFDGDGRTNRQEYEEGTNPMDPGSARQAYQDDLVAVTAGSFKTQHDGSANYTVPITLPPGVNGLVPELGLNYNSNGGNSWLGVGWSLAAYSVITRGPTSFSKDGFVDPADFDENDRFYLNNDLLVGVAGHYGTDGAEYRTEHDTFQKITSHGSELNGPVSFVVRTKGGLVQTFRPLALPAVRARASEPLQGNALWVLSRVEDQSANWIAFDYGVLATGYRLDRVTYGGCRSANPVGTVTFQYDGTRSDTSGRFFAGSLVEFRERLSAITVFNHDPEPRLFREYVFTYSGSPVTGRTRLASLTEVGADGSKSPPLQFDYQRSGEPGSPAWDQWVESPDLVPAHPLVGTAGADIGTRLIDLDGDSIPECIRSQRGNDGDLIQYAPSGFPALPVPIVNAAGLGIGLAFVDLDGNGYTDILFGPPASSSETRAAYLLMPGAGGAPPTWQYAAGFEPPADLALSAGATNPAVRLADVNGDGLVDFLYAMKASDGTTERYTYLNTGEGWSQSRHEAYRPPLDFFDAGLAGGMELGVQLIDLNADQLPDIMKGVSIGGQLLRETWMNTGRGWKRSFDPYLLAPLDLTTPDIRIRDVNRDGLPDLLRYPTGDATLLATYLNSGDGWLKTSPGLRVGRFAFDGIAGGSNVQFADVNGDGYVDILETNNNPGGEQATRRTFFNDEDGLFSLGSQFSAHVRPPVDLAKFGVIVVDLNGDGLEDILDASNPSETRCWMNTASGADLLVAVRSRGSADFMIEYGSMNEGGTFVEKGGDADDAPDTQYATDGRYMVKRTISDDGSGVQIAKSWRYGGYKRRPLGIGVLGFAWIEESDLQTGITTTSRFTQQHPLVGRTRSVEIRQPNGNLIRSVSTQWELRGYQPGTSTSFHAVPLSTTESAYELDGTLTYSETTLFDYDEFGNLTRTESDRGGGFTQVAINVHTNDINRWIIGKLIHSTVTKTAPGTISRTKTSAFRYDEQTGLLAAEIVEPGTPLQLETRYLRDECGNIVRTESDGPGVAMRFHDVDYDKAGRYKLVESNALGHRSFFERDPASGRISRERDRNGLESTFTYDALGRKASYRRPDGITERSVYFWGGGVGHPQANHRLVVSRSDGAPIIRYYDGFHRLIRVEAVNGDGEKVLVDQEFNHQGWLSRVSNPYSIGQAIHWTTHEYDLLGRTVRTTHPDGSVSTTGHSGFVTETTNVIGQVSRSFTDIGERLIRVERDPGTAVDYQYDASGNLVRTVTDGLVSTATFDARDRRISFTSPDTGISEARYNAFDEVVWQRNAAGEVTEYSYDVLGRMVQRTEPEGISTWTFDIATGSGIGQIAAVSGPTGTVSRVYAYDNIGRAVETVEHRGPIQYRFESTYDPLSRLQSITYPSGFSLRYDYTPFGALDRVSRPVSGMIYWQAEDRDQFGNVTAELLGNNLRTTRDYHPAKGSLDSIVTTGDADIQRQGFAFDSLGNLTMQSDAVEASQTNYSYDAFNRIITKTKTGSPAEQFSYDIRGNLLTHGADSLHYEQAGSNRLTRVVRAGNAHIPVYDPKGNMVHGVGGSQLVFNTANLPVSVTEGAVTRAFHYGPDREMISQTEINGLAGTTTNHVLDIYEERQSFEDSTITSTHQEHHIKVNGRVVATVSDISDSDGARSSTRWWHRDHLGSVVAVTDEAGAVTDRFNYAPFGGRSGPQPIDEHALARGFTGHLHLPGSTLIHMKGRIYDSSLGRFLSPDPFVQAPGDPQSHNRYAYVMNNPLSLHDPSGFISLKTFGIFTNPEWVGNFVRGMGALHAGAYWYGTGDYYTAREIYGSWMKAAAYVDGFMGILYEQGGKLAIVTLVTYATAGATSGAAAWYYSAAIVAATTFTVNYAQGESVEDSAEAAAYAFITAAAFSGVHSLSEAAKWDPGSLEKVIVHGVVGGITAEMKGDEFDTGFVSAASAQALSRHIDEIQIGLGRIAAAAIVGGVVAEGTGGRFGDGAQSAAFARLFNDENGKLSDGNKSTESGQDKKSPDKGGIGELPMKLWQKWWLEIVPYFKEKFDTWHHWLDKIIGDIEDDKKVTD